jgi:RNA polymerase sigma factor (sigma-70 family)
MPQEAYVSADHEGAEHDFEAWYRDAYPSVRAAIGILAGEEHASEATAEAFAKAYQRWRRVSQMGSPSGWTYRVAENEVRRLRRRAMVERALWRRTPSADRGHLQAEVILDLQRELKKLPPRMRTAVVLRYIGDLAEQDIAAAMGISRGGVSALLAKARERLSVQLADDEEAGLRWNR